MSQQQIRAPLAAAIALAMGTAAPATLAQQLEEVIVTAQKRVESIQDAPLSVAAFSESMLENQGIQTLGDLTLQAPSLQAYDFPTSTSNVSLFLRGFGNTDSQTLTIDNPIGIYIDGVYISRTSGATLNVLDLERVEILRGPQGTLFGRNSSAGAVNFITKKPAEEFRASFNAGVGNFGQYSAGGDFDVPLGDRLRTKLSFDTEKRDGWVENTGPNGLNGQPGNDYYYKDQQGGRFALTWDATDNLTVDYAYDRSEIDSTAQYYQQNRNGRQEETTHLLLGGQPYQYVLPESSTEMSGHNLTVQWLLGNGMTLKSITGYRDMEELAWQNWSDTLFFATMLDWSTESFSQEFQWLGTALDQRLDYIVGLYYFDEDGSKDEEQFTNGASFSLDALAEPLASTSILLGGNNLGIHTIETSLESKAIYGQFTYTPTVLDSRLSFTLGLRYTEDERDATRGVDPANPTIQFPPGANSLSYERTDYTAVVDFDFSDNISAYARIATGYRAGGSGERTLDFSQTFDEEDNISYELGLKSEMFDRRVRVNAALFATNYDNYILTISGQPPMFASFVENVNAGEAEINGIEIDVTAALTESTTLTVNYSYLDTSLSDVIVPDDSFLLGGPPASAVDRRGQDISDSTFIAFASENALSLALDHAVLLSGGSVMNFHLDYAWRDEVFSQPGMGLPVNDLGLLNGRVSWSGLELGATQWQVSLWAKNLSDEEEIVYNLSNAGFQYSIPRTYGVELELQL